MKPLNSSQDAMEPPRYFDAEALGASFEQLAIDVTRGEKTDFMSRWFRSRQGQADLVIWTDGEKRIIKHQLCFFGQVVEWNPINGTRTGLVVEEEMSDDAFDGLDAEETAARVMSQASSDSGEGDLAETIRFDSETQSSVVLQAVRVLSAVPELSEEDRHKLIVNLRESRRLHKSARERALKEWAPKADELNSNRRPTFWNRFRNWVLGG